MELSVRLKKVVQDETSVTLSNRPLDAGTGDQADEENGPVLTRKQKAAVVVAKVLTPNPAQSEVAPFSLDPHVTLVVVGPAVAGGMFGVSLEDGVEFQVTVSART